MNSNSQGNFLLDYFIRNTKRPIYKWLDYFEVYHRLFDRYRERELKFLEIGVQNGGSTHMWQDYFGPKAKIIGLDIDPQCKQLAKDGFEIWTGDQADPEFWRGFKQKHSKLDIILDDGGHTMEQQITTFRELFPLLADGGLFVCEDTHSSYFPTHGGGLGRQGTFHEFVKHLIDDMHAWYHSPLSQMDQQYFAKNVYSISVYDSIISIEKRAKNPPQIFTRAYDGDPNKPILRTWLDFRRDHGVPD